MSIVNEMEKLKTDIYKNRWYFDDFRIKRPKDDMGNKNLK